MTQQPYQGQQQPYQGPPQQQMHGAHAIQPYGQPYPPMPTAAPKSPGVALILSVLICGLGHLYTGNPLSAVFWFATAVVVGTIGVFTAGIGFILLPFVYLGACIHAYISAGNFNRRHHAVR